MACQARVFWGSVLLWMWIANGIAAPCAPWVTRVVSIQGTIEVKRVKENEWSRVRLNDRFCAGDSIRTNVYSRAGLMLRNETLLRLDQRTTLILPQLYEEDSAWLELERGAVHFISNIPYQLKIKTPFTNAAIEGTEFAMRVSDAGTTVWVLEGKVSVDNAQGRISLGPGEAAVAEAGKAPVPYLKITPRDAVQWALYYPPIIDYRPSMAVDPQRQRAVTLYRTGQIPAAIEALTAVPDAMRDGSFFTHRAGLLLTVGQVQSAQSDIEKALTLSPNSGAPRALQSVIALTRNDKAKALLLAQEAVKLEPKSPTPQVALSYAQQAAFDIEGARESIKKALELAPDDPLAWARLSELELSTGELDDALDAAQKAEALDPDLSRTQMVLGFAQLMEIDIDEAKESFAKAIALDPSAPLPRLGMGLAKIRQGDVEKGRQDIEVAAVLDPENSLIRSYLGKAYYEEKRGDVASREFAMAKQLDPKDPTPWFYDAIYKQTVNRPVEALHDMQKAIELNDNRAVYRSSLLLDDDLAARSASLGRIYNNLGFEQLGLLEGWRSANKDPSNYSAHRLLADNYAALPRHEIARVSELLQSQLLQPINLTPVQPQLAETNLLPFDGLGPASLSFNEFNPLFTRNRFALQLSGVVGSNDTYGDEVVQSGLWEGLSYSLGQFHFQTGGFRPNSDLNTNIYNVFMQARLSERANLQFELRRENTNSGDLRQVFDPDLLFPTASRQSLDRDSARVGFNISIDSNTNLLGFVSYGKLYKNLKIPTFLSFSSIFGPPFDSLLLPFLPSGFDMQTEARDRLENWSTEIQFIGHWHRSNLIVGGGHVNQNKLRTTVLTSSLSSPLESNLIANIPPGLLNAFVIPVVNGLTITAANGTSAEGSNENHAIGYVYSTTEVINDLDLTLGVSFDYINRDSSQGSSLRFKRRYLNPKFGLVWKPFDATTLRAAYFKTVKRPFASNQTIEPTHVSGFTQFVDDPDSARSTRYGFGIDQQLLPALRVGGEISWRDMTAPRFISGVDAEILPISQQENSHRAYLYWTANQNVALSAEYFFQSFDRSNSPQDSLPTGVPSKIATHRVPLTLSYFCSCGLFGSLVGTYIDQSVTLSGIRGHDNFWIMDATIGYRLPRRLGIINLGVRNVLDQKFNVHEENFNIVAAIEGGVVQPQFVPERVLFTQITLAF